MEDVGRVTKWAYQPGAGTAGSDPSTSTCINIEWGGFSSASLPRCGEDEAEDAEVHAGGSAPGCRFRVRGVRCHGLELGLLAGLLFLRGSLEGHHRDSGSPSRASASNEFAQTQDRATHKNGPEETLVGRTSCVCGTRVSRVLGASRSTLRSRECHVAPQTSASNFESKAP